MSALIKTCVLYTVRASALENESAELRLQYCHALKSYAPYNPPYNTNCYEESSRTACTVSRKVMSNPELMLKLFKAESNERE